MTPITENIDCNSNDDHAEARLLSKLEFKKHKHFDVVVIRLTKTGKLASSRPCHHCINRLSKYPVRYVYYSTTDNYLIRENIHQLKEGHQHLTANNKRNLKK